MLNKLKTRFANLNRLGKVIAIIVSIVFLCCCLPFGLLTANVTLHVVGILPTYTPTPEEEQPTEIAEAESIQATAPPPDTPTSPEPTDTSEPTEKPTETPEPTNTARPSNTPRPTNTPRLTATAEPTNTPSPQPTQALAATEPPAPTQTLASTEPPPTNTPQPTQPPPTNTPQPEPTQPPPTEPPALPGDVQITFIFYDGAQPQTEGDEYAVITNQGGTAVNL